MAPRLLKQLERIKKTDRAAVNENSASHSVNERTYYARNGQIVAACDELIAFQVNASKGTQNTNDLAVKGGKKVIVFSYKTRK